MARLVAPTPYPFLTINVKQSIVMGANEDASKQTIITFVQAMDTYGTYREWKLFQSPWDLGFGYQNVPIVREWTNSRLGAEGDLRALGTNFSKNGKYLIRMVLGDRVVLQNCEQGVKSVSATTSTIKFEDFSCHQTASG